MEKVTEEVIGAETEGTKEAHVEEVVVDEGTKTTEEETPNVEPKITQERTQEQVDEIIQRRLDRENKKHEREIRKYKSIIDTLSIGTGTQDLDEINQALIQSYEEQGVNVPQNQRSEREETILAKADAQEIIELGKEEMEAEANRLASIPYTNRTTREKAIFNELGAELTKLKALEELEDKGIKTDILEDKDFKEFAKDYNPNVSVLKIYEIYEKTKGNAAPTTPKPMGSVKDTAKSNEIKEYYTQEEIKKFTKEELMANPKLMDAVENSLIAFSKGRK